MYYRIRATLSVRGWAHDEDIPEFLIDARVHNVSTEQQAMAIAAQMLNPFKDRRTIVSGTAERVD